MRHTLIRAAVAAAIAAGASTSALAAGLCPSGQVCLNISGASAQRTFWESDLEALATGTYGSVTDQSSPAVQVCFLTKTSAKLLDTTQSPAAPIPDLHALQCTVSANRGASPPALPTGIVAGTVINLYYEAEFGSVWGIAPFLPGSTANARGGRNELVELAAGGTQAVTQYSRDLDTATGGLQGPVPVDIGVSDAEPVLWASADNWAYSDGINGSPPTIDGTGTNGVINVLAIPGQGQPTLAQLQALQAQWTEVNGEVFSVVVDDTAAPTNTITSLSTQSLRSIFTGAYTTWAQVPEVGTGGNIAVCRRDHGSGTQVTSSLFFTQTECGGNNGVAGNGSAAGSATRFVSDGTSPLGANSGALGAVNGVDTIVANPLENFSSSDIKACLAANPGVAIGILALSPGSGYTTVKVNGIEANAHNTALGLYPYYSQTWAFNNTGTTQPGTAAANLAARLILDAQKETQGVLPKENGAFASNQWVASGTASGQVVAFGLQDNAFNPKPTVAAAAETGNPSSPVAVWKNANQSLCTIETNSNH